MAEFGSPAATPQDETKLSFEELKAKIDVPNRDLTRNPSYSPLERLQVIRELDLDPLEKRAEKDELMRLFDKRATELFSDEINVPGKDVVANKDYVPMKRLEVIREWITEFPFGSEETRSNLLRQADIKKQEISKQ